MKRGTDRHVSGVRRPAAINPIWEKGRREREGTTYVEILQIQWPSHIVTTFIASIPLIRSFLVPQKGKSVAICKC